MPLSGSRVARYLMILTAIAMTVMGVARLGTLVTIDVNPSQLLVQTKSYLVTVDDLTGGSEDLPLSGDDEVNAMASKGDDHKASMLSVDSLGKYFSLDELKTKIGFRCPASRHCSLWDKSFLKGGSWSQGVFSPYNCWWYQFNAAGTTLQPDQGGSKVALLLSGAELVYLFAPVAERNPALFKHIVVDFPEADSGIGSLMKLIEASYPNRQRQEVHVFMNWIDMEEARLKLLVSAMTEQLGFKQLKLYWVNRAFSSAEHVDHGVIKVNQQTMRLLKAMKTLVTYVDVFAPSLFSPEDIENPARSPLLVSYTANTILNYMLAPEIVSAAQSAQHVCHSESHCSSCLMVASRVPSKRLTFKLLANYFTKHATPTVITLDPDAKLWQGSWHDLMEKNGNATITVRTDYKSTKTRHMSKVSLKRYLRAVHIVETDKPLTKGLKGANDTLPLYAGNNKLSAESMKDFKFKYPVWFQASSLQRPAMWLGPKNSISSLHIDHRNQGNLAYQILGEKLWHLFSPEARPYCYPIQSVVIWSRIPDPREYDTDLAKRFPLFRQAIANSMYVKVKEGEMLYNPDEWGHAVYNTEASLMLNFWLKTGKLEARKLSN